MLILVQIDSGVTTIGGSTPNASTIFSDIIQYHQAQILLTQMVQLLFNFYRRYTSTSSSTPASYNYQLYVATIDTTNTLNMYEYALLDSEYSN